MSGGGRGGGGWGGGGLSYGFGSSETVAAVRYRWDVKTKDPCGEEAELWEVLSLVGLGCVRIEL